MPQMKLTDHNLVEIIQTLTPTERAAIEGRATEHRPE